MNSSTSPDEKNNDLPMVFQCENCRTVVGDTICPVIANNSLRLITLDKVTNKVRIREKLISSSSSADLGSSYNPLICETCNSDLGRIYRTTTFQLDDLRNKYSLYIDRLSFYRLDSGEMTSEHLNNGNIQSYKQLEQEILKLQAVSVSFNSRIIQLEERLKEELNLS
ncbi:hypothetical protein SNE40_021001 [Patella caerulea]|uniref:Mis18 domain-containing protein n=1 Tax=Patella caerulea TaxID=87958 RepID=A0AAN8G1D8_PATCE